MKQNITCIIALLTVICTMNSCSSDESEVADVSAKKSS
jgi:hypothetical protein